VDPIPNVRVYVPVTTPLQPFPTNYCDECVSPIDPAWTSTVTAADGTFTLGLDAVPASTTIPFAIQIGRFRKWTTVPVGCSASAQTVPKAAETLPGATVPGTADIPKIAVSSGNVDHLDAVLNTLGITEFTCYEGRANMPSYASSSTCSNPVINTATNLPYMIGDVLQNSTAGDPNSIDSYNMAFLSCAPGAYAYSVAPTSGGGHGNNQAAMTANTHAWVTAGGRMFVTDTAYDYIAQAFPANITWQGPAGTPQPVDGANIGCAPANAMYSSAHAVPYPITVDDVTLAAWLKVVGFSTSPNVTVQGFYEPWSAISSLAPSSTLIADGVMPIDPAIKGGSCTTAATQMQDVPLTAKFDVPTCGRVLFSSYHTYTGTGAAASTANEKIMEYMIFAAAYCTH
jgi:hypothetical protein